MEIPTPMFDRVVVDPEQEPNITEGGIIIPDTVRKVATHGKVIAVGPGKSLTPHEVGPRSPHMAVDGNHGPVRPMTLQIGDVVHYNEYAAQVITIGSSTYVVLEEGDVLAYNRD